MARFDRRFSALHLLRTVGFPAQRVAGAILALAIVATPLVAFAEALVIVEVRGGDDATGQVTLSPQSADGASYQCSVSGGSCRIDGVSGGRYRVSFRAAGGGETTQSAVIPPSGTVTLVLPAP